MARGNAVVPGMNSGINVNDPRVASAFLAALRHQGLVAVLTSFTTFDEAHGFAVNLTAVIALTAIGVVFMTRRERLVRPAMIAFAWLCLADWLLTQDLGFQGGLGTDPNSMIPMILLAAGGYLAVTQDPVTADEVAAASQTRGDHAAWRDAIRPANLRVALARSSFSSIISRHRVTVALVGLAMTITACGTASPRYGGGQTAGVPPLSLATA